MARTKQTELAVLCVLSVRRMSGYAVRAAIRDQLGFFWSESFGQIYPTLAILAKSGVIERHSGPKRGASTYSLTPSGRTRMLALLGEPDIPSPRRDGLMLRLFFGRNLGPDACRTLVERAREAAAGKLETYTAVRAEVESEAEYPEQRAYWLITISAGEHSARAAIAWADQTLAALDENRSDYLL